MLTSLAGHLASLADSKTINKTALVLSLGAGAGVHAGRPFWQYFPAGSTGYSSAWLTRGMGWSPPYATGAQAASKLALPYHNPGTAVRSVYVPWWRYVSGPRRSLPDYGQPGGGLEYYLGGFP